MTELHFQGTARLAALHLLDSDFGRRLREISTISDTDETLLRVEYDTDATFTLSSGELTMLTVLQAVGGGAGVWLDDLQRLDDPSWDRFVGALFILRGRVLAGGAR